MADPTTTPETPPILGLGRRILAIMEDAGAVAKAKGQPGVPYAHHKIDDIEETLRPLLIRHGVTVWATVADHGGSRHTYKKNDGSEGTQFEEEAEVLVTFENADDPEDRREVTFYGQGIDYSDKGPGKAISYALKACYLATFHLRGQPDAEDNDHKRQGAPPASRGKSSGDADPVLPFGKHMKGKRISELDPGALKWLAEDYKKDDQFKAAARARLGAMEADQDTSSRADQLGAEYQQAVADGGWQKKEAAEAFGAMCKDVFGRKGLLDLADDERVILLEWLRMQGGWEPGFFEDHDFRAETVAAVKEWLDVEAQRQEKAADDAETP